MILDILSMEILTFAGAKITILNLLLFFTVIFGTFIISKYVIRKILDSILEKSRIEKEARFTLLKVVHYLTMFIGFWIAFNVLGIQLTALLAVVGIAGIILGFGLQPIIANFISGLILMSERTVQVGNWIEIDGRYGKVIEAGVRASTIRTMGNLHVIVPNRAFVENAFVNYSHGDKRIRIDVPIGVKYGSDVEKVKNVLLKIAEDNEDVLDNPEPIVYFKEFADSSLNFELKCWVRTPRYRPKVLSELNFEIDRRFAEEGIEIPFPQRDVWLKE